MKGKWNDFFLMTNSERRAALVLFFLFLFFLIMHISGPQFRKTDQVDLEFRALVKHYLDSIGESRASHPVFYQLNSVSAQELVEQGITRKIAFTLIKYRESIGGFTKMEQIKNVYGVDSTMFLKLTAFLLAPPEENNLTSDSSPPRQKIPADYQIQSTSNKSNPESFGEKPELAYSSAESVSIAVNQASELEWQKLPGIGPYYAKRIVKFRDALGGFSNIEQIAETYHLPDTVFQKIKSQLKIDQPTLKKDIEKLKIADLAAHPYISSKQAEIIHNFVQQHQPLDSIEQLYDIRIFDSAYIQKLIPYYRNNKRKIDHSNN